MDISPSYSTHYTFSPYASPPVDGASTRLFITMYRAVSYTRAVLLSSAHSLCPYLPTAHTNPECPATKTNAKRHTQQSAFNFIVSPLLPCMSIIPGRPPFSWTLYLFSLHFQSTVSFPVSLYLDRTHSLDLHVRATTSWTETQGSVPRTACAIC